MPWTTPGTATAGSVLTAAWLNTNVRDNLNMVAPVMSAATSFTPTLGNTWANGNATTTGKYFQIGKLVIFWAQIVIGSTTTKGASGMTLSVPVTASNVLTYSSIQYSYENVGVNVFFGTGCDYVSSTTSFLYAVYGNSFASVTATAPFTFATGSKIYYSGTYEAA